MVMREVYIVAAKRTAIGRFGGTLKSLSSSDLAAPVIQQDIKRYTDPV